MTKIDLNSHKPCDFVFGKTKVRGVYAGPKNPHRDGTFVEIIRRTGRVNSGTFVRLTDGHGDFWEYEMRSVVIWKDGETEESIAARAELRFQELRGEKA